jgi:hypothetical protein
MQSLVEKYRPRTIDSFAGLDRVKPILAAFAATPYPTAFLFLGPSGTGKTTMALALFEAIGAELIHVPSRKCDLDTVQDLLYRCHLTPMFGPSGWHGVLVDEADQMSRAAQHSFLSALDTTGFPPDTVFIFTANTTLAGNGAAGLEDRFLSRVKTLQFTTDGLEAAATRLLHQTWLAEVRDRQQDRRRRLPDPPDFRAMIREARFNLREGLNTLETEILVPGSFVPIVPSQRGAATALAAGDGKIYTVGYLGISLPALEEIVDTLGATLIIDVRSIAKTRVAGFSRGELEQSFGRRYRWAGDRLGDNSVTEEGLGWLESLQRSGAIVMLLGKEEVPGLCHRHHLIAKQLNSRGVEVHHLLCDELIASSELQQSIDQDRDYEYVTWREPQLMRGEQA